MGVLWIVITLDNITYWKFIFSWKIDSSTVFSESICSLIRNAASLMFFSFGSIFRGLTVLVVIIFQLFPNPYLHLFTIYLSIYYLKVFADHHASIYQDWGNSWLIHKQKEFQRSLFHFQWQKCCTLTLIKTKDFGDNRRDKFHSSFTPFLPF